MQPHGKIATLSERNLGTKEYILLNPIYKIPEMHYTQWQQADQWFPEARRDKGGEEDAKWDRESTGAVEMFPYLTSVAGQEVYTTVIKLYTLKCMGFWHSKPACILWSHIKVDFLNQRPLIFYNKWVLVWATHHLTTFHKAMVSVKTITSSKLR